MAEKNQRRCDCATCASRGGCDGLVWAGRCVRCRQGDHRPLLCRHGNRSAVCRTCAMEAVDGTYRLPPMVEIRSRGDCE